MSHHDGGDPDKSSRADHAGYESDSMSRGAVIASFVFGGIALIATAFIATHLQNAPPPPVPPRISIVDTDTVARNPFVISFVTDKPVRNGPMGIVWGTSTLHPHLTVDSTMLMPGFISRHGVQANDVVTSIRDTFKILVPRLSPGRHTIHLFWANTYHMGVGDTATIWVNVLK